MNHEALKIDLLDNFKWSHSKIQNNQLLGCLGEVDHTGDGSEIQLAPKKAPHQAVKKWRCHGGKTTQQKSQ